MSKEKDDDDEIDLLELTISIIRRTWRRKVLAAVSFVLVLGIAFYVAMTAVTFYKTEAKIIYQAASSSTTGGNLGALASLAGLSMKKGDDPSAYLEDIILSRYMLQSILNEKWLLSKALPDTDMDTLTPVPLQTLWKIKPDTTHEGWQIALEHGLIGTLRGGRHKYIVFTQDKKTGIIKLTTEFQDPRVSFDVNNFIFNQLNDILLNRMHFKASENRKFIEERLAEMRQTLKESEDDLRMFRQRNKLRIDPTEELEDARLLREVTTNQGIMIQLRTQYELAKIEEARDMPVLDIIDASTRPIYPSKPKRKLIVLIGGMAAVFFAILFASLYDIFLEKKDTWRKYVS